MKRLWSSRSTPKLRMGCSSSRTQDDVDTKGTSLATSGRPPSTVSSFAAGSQRNINSVNDDGDDHHHHQDGAQNPLKRPSQAPSIREKAEAPDSSYSRHHATDCPTTSTSVNAAGCSEIRAPTVKFARILEACDSVGDDSASAPSSAQCTQALGPARREANADERSPPHPANRSHKSSKRVSFLGEDHPTSDRELLHPVQQLQRQQQHSPQPQSPRVFVGVVATRSRSGARGSPTVVPPPHGVASLSAGLRTPPPLSLRFANRLA